MDREHARRDYPDPARVASCVDLYSAAWKTAAPLNRTVEEHMNYRHLGASGLQVSELSLGSWTTYGGSVAAEDAARIVHRAFELGVNLFDTADVYVRGEAERALALGIKDLPREQIVVATKVMGRLWEGPLGAGLSRKHIFDAVHQSLGRLGLDYIDLYQAHAPDAK